MFDCIKQCDVYRSVSGEYTAPVGLLGLMTTMALVRSVILARMSAMSGVQSAGPSPG